jgi:hypothetical protein
MLEMYEASLGTEDDERAVKQNMEGAREKCQL